MKLIVNKRANKYKSILIVNVYFPLTTVYSECVLNIDSFERKFYKIWCIADILYLTPVLKTGAIIQYDLLKQHVDLSGFVNLPLFFRIIEKPYFSFPFTFSLTSLVRIKLLCLKWKHCDILHCNSKIISLKILSLKDLGMKTLNQSIWTIISSHTHRASDCNWFQMWYFESSKLLWFKNALDY